MYSFCRKSRILYKKLIKLKKIQNQKKMEDLKSFSLYNQRLNNLIKSYQSKNLYSIHNLQASLSKKIPDKLLENFNKTNLKTLYINKQFDELMKEKLSISSNNSHNISISKVLMNFSTEKHEKKYLLPFLKGKKNNTTNFHSESKMNRTFRVQSPNNKSKILLLENRSKTPDSHLNFLFHQENQIGIQKKPFTPIKISLKYRKNCEKKVEGKYDSLYIQEKKTNHNPNGFWKNN